MSTASIRNIEALDRLRVRFLRLADPDATPLMFAWSRTIEEDNRKGVLAGTDRDGKPLAPVAYRPRAARIDQGPASQASRGAPNKPNSWSDRRSSVQSIAGWLRRDAS
jgi:hypothetical protein